MHGYASERVWKQILPLTDYVLFDLKHMDRGLHRRFTGRPNSRILDNARWLAENGVPVMFRVPLVPGFTDTLENIRATADFVNSLRGNCVQGIDLMLYHRMGIGKYESLDREYSLKRVNPPEPAEAESVSQRFEDSGLRCTVSR